MDNALAGRLLYLECCDRLTAHKAPRATITSNKNAQNEPPMPHQDMPVDHQLPHICVTTFG